MANEDTRNEARECIFSMLEGVKEKESSFYDCITIELVVLGMLTFKSKDEARRWVWDIMESSYKRHRELTILEDLTKQGISRPANDI
ncbi:MAG: hypothetical protein ACUZ8E_18075 [Candidatus Anammoxibacter sp.]